MISDFWFQEFVELEAVETPSGDYFLPYSPLFYKVVHLSTIGTISDACESDNTVQDKWCEDTATR